MQFSGEQLRGVLSNQLESIAVYDERSFTRGTVQPSGALNLVEGGERKSLTRVNS